MTRIILVPGDDHRLDAPCGADGNRAESHRTEPERRRLEQVRRTIRDAVDSEVTLEALLKLADGEHSCSDLARTWGIHRANAGRRVKGILESIRRHILCSTMLQSLEDDGGFTLDVRSGNLVREDAWAVSLKAYQTEFPGFPTMAQLEADLVRKSRIILSAPMPWYLGGWIKARDNVTHLDITQLVVDEQQAIAFAALNNQTSIYHLTRRIELWLDSGGQWQSRSA